LYIYVLPPHHPFFLLQKRHKKKTRRGGKKRKVFLQCEIGAAFLMPICSLLSLTLALSTEDNTSQEKGNTIKMLFWITERDATCL
jgi:hypothetical protein